MNNTNGFMEKLISGMNERARQEMAPGDYVGKDGLIYCGNCHTPKQKRFSDGPLAGEVVPVMCRCESEQRKKETAEQEARAKEQHIRELKERGFLSRSMWDWTFANDNGRNPQMDIARKYVSSWERMREKNIGLLVWGDVGCGKSYLAGAIANALMEKEIPVRMTNFSAIINDLSASFEGRNEYLTSLCGFPLLIIDDFGMERGTEYGLEQVYSVIDGRYRSGKPLIVTTNLTLSEIRNTADTAHKRIYDRVLEMCVPIFCRGESCRRKSAEEKMKELKSIIEGGNE